MGRMKNLLEHVTLTYLTPDGHLHYPITANMFSYTDIEKVTTDQFGTSVKFRGINGIIPYNFFTEKSKKKIETHIKVINSPLWRVLND